MYWAFGSADLKTSKKKSVAIFALCLVPFNRTLFFLLCSIRNATHKETTSIQWPTRQNNNITRKFACVSSVFRNEMNARKIEQNVFIRSSYCCKPSHQFSCHKWIILLWFEKCLHIHRTGWKAIRFFSTCPWRTTFFFFIR